MSVDPFASIAAEASAPAVPDVPPTSTPPHGATAAPPAGPPAPATSWLQKALERLQSSSPRSFEYLRELDIAKRIDEFVDTRTGRTAAGEAGIGAAAMDCWFAIRGEGESPTGNASPIVRLLRAVSLWMWKVRDVLGNAGGAR